MDKITKNKKAFFDYTIEDTLLAGIVLVGSEVKSIRNKDVSIKEAYCLIDNDEMWLRGMHIAEFKESGKYQNHDTVRDRKLLLNKREIFKLSEKIAQKGMTIVPLSVIINNRGLIKVEIGLASGKRQYDKRQVIKERDVKRDIDRNETV
jgi:SsrA-binding protein